MRAVAAVAVFWLLGTGSARAEGFITPFVGFNLLKEIADHRVMYRRGIGARARWPASDLERGYADPP